MRISSRCCTCQSRKCMLITCAPTDNHQQSKLIDDNRIVSTSSNNSLIIIRDTITLQSLHSISNPSASPPKDPTAANQHYPPILSINRNQVVATNNSSNTIIFVHDPLHSNTATKLQINDYASFEWLPLSTSNTLLVNSNHHVCYLFICGSFLLSYHPAFRGLS